MQFIDAATGKINFGDWAAHDAQAAAAFADKNLMDAQVGMAFLTPQLYRIETEVYQTRYPSFDYSGLMFVNTDGDMWDIGSVFYSGDIAGKAEFISGKGFDMPFADIGRSQHFQGSHLAGIGYEWTTQEMQRAAKLGRSLSSEKALAAQKVAEAFIFNIAMLGSPEKGTTGLLNNPSVPTAAAPNGDWATATPDEILADVNEILFAPNQATNEVHNANTLLLPTDKRQVLNNRRMGDGSDTTILNFIVANNAYKAETGQDLTIRATRKLATGTMMAYDNSREAVQFHLPGPHEFLPAYQKSSMTYEIGGIMNIGGVEFRLPKSAAYRTGL